MANSRRTDSARGMRNGREAIGSDSRDVAFSIRAAFRGDRIPSELMFPAVSKEAAEPPMAAAQPLSLFLRVHFEGLLPVAESDMICRGGRICCFNLSKVDPLSQKALLLLSLNRTQGLRFALAHQRFMTDKMCSMKELSRRGRERCHWCATPRENVWPREIEFPAKNLYPTEC